jgi:hypothetical protein
MTPGYLMGYQEPVQTARVKDFVQGRLDIDDMVLLAQDVIEAGVLPSLSVKFFTLAQHMVDRRLCTCTGRALH